MSIQRRRQKNLIMLADDYGVGGLSKIADLVDCEISSLSRIKSGRKNLGASLARRIEIAAGKPSGWLDHEHCPNQNT